MYIEDFSPEAIEKIKKMRDAIKNETDLEKRKILSKELREYTLMEEFGDRNWRRFTYPYDED